jgi:hypothetical protein
LGTGEYKREGQERTEDGGGREGGEMKEGKIMQDRRGEKRTFHAEGGE